MLCLVCGREVETHLDKLPQLTDLQAVPCAPTYASNTIMASQGETGDTSSQTIYIHVYKMNSCQPNVYAYQ